MSTAAEVTAHLSDGHVVRGVVDARSTDQALWIRVEEGQVTMAVALDWNRIQHVDYADAQHTPQEFARLVDDIATPETNALFLQRDVASEHSAPAPPTEGTRLTTQDAAHPGKPQMVEALEIRAYLRNWDRDVEPDGLELHLLPVGADGRTVAIRGNVSARLVGTKYGRRRDDRDFRDLERWSDSVQPENFTPGYAVVRLPFRLIQPQFDTQLAPYALLHVHVNVYGQGSFEASTTVRLREYEAIRDHSQLIDGKRYFRNELTSQPRR
ncbi:MAG: hypothetical protein KDA42_07795 [Planctomycetales bacterium]|nr:hypothetical protein [Planctomycetales bacterium]